MNRLEFRPPGACIIRLITAVIYSFRNKLECLSLNTRLGWKRLTRDKQSFMIQGPDIWVKGNVGIPTIVYIFKASSSIDINHLQLQDHEVESRFLLLLHLLVLLHDGDHPLRQRERHARRQLLVACIKTIDMREYIDCSLTRPTCLVLVE